MRRRGRGRARRRRRGREREETVSVDASPEKIRNASAAKAATVSRGMGRRVSLIVAVGVALWAAPGVAAASQAPSGTAKVDPTTPSAGAHLLIDAQGADGGGFHRQQIPTALAIDLQKGFAF